MCSTVTVAASVLATHYVDLTRADAEATVAERLRDTGLIIFDGSQDAAACWLSPLGSWP